ncbi:hypothetical protein V1264_014215 [Littorina saxatilis]|uniref:Uncharacterized protein n=1 Tax=Littorina saxatilis TaxID=31220 RepID=A0AAN9BPX9_9CAEN
MIDTFTFLKGVYQSQRGDMIDTFTFLKGVYQSQRGDMIDTFTFLKGVSQRGDMIDTFKFLKGVYQSQRPKFTKPQSTSYDTRGNSQKLFKNFVNTRVRRTFISERVVLDWNSLPDNAVAVDTVNGFKSKLDTYWNSTRNIYIPSCLC